MTRSPSGPSSRMCEPRMSLGMRSANLACLKSRPMSWARALTRAALPTPGTPSSSTCPLLRMPTRTSRWRSSAQEDAVELFEQLPGEGDRVLHLVGPQEGVESVVLHETNEVACEQTERIKSESEPSNRSKSEIRMSYATSISARPSLFRSCFASSLFRISRFGFRISSLTSLSAGQRNVRRCSWCRGSTAWARAALPAAAGSTRAARR